MFYSHCRKHDHRSTPEALKTKLERLLDSFLEQDIERDAYLRKKVELIGEKKSLEEKITHLEHGQNRWIEPMKEWIKEAENMEKIVHTPVLSEKKIVLKKIFGSNLLLEKKIVVAREEKNRQSSPKNQWAALSAAHENFGSLPESLVLVAPRGVEPLLRG